MVVGMRASAPKTESFLSLLADSPVRPTEPSATAEGQLTTDEEFAWLLSNTPPVLLEFPRDLTAEPLGIAPLDYNIDWLFPDPTEYVCGA